MGYALLVYHSVFVILGLIINHTSNRSLVRCFIKLIMFLKLQDRLWERLTFHMWMIFGSLNKCLG